MIGVLRVRSMLRRRRQVSTIDHLFWVLSRNMLTDGGRCCMHCTLIPPCVGSAKVFDVTGANAFVMLVLKLEAEKRCAETPSLI